jgi:hypothetical protein
LKYAFSTTAAMAASTMPEFNSGSSSLGSFSKKAGAVQFRKGDLAD